MGYYTRFELSAAPVPSLRSPGDAVTDFVKGSEEAAHCLLNDGAANDSGKWYEHEEELLEFSKKYPHLIFTLRGEGEEAGDIWAKYFNDGKVQVEKASVQVASFDPERLR